MSPACADLFCVGTPRRTANKSCLDSKEALVSCNLMVEHLQALMCIWSTVALQCLLNSGEHCANRPKSLQRAWSSRSGFICLRADFSVSDRLFTGGEMWRWRPMEMPVPHQWLEWEPDLPIWIGCVRERAICHYPIMRNEHVSFDCCPVLLDC